MAGNNVEFGGAYKDLIYKDPAQELLKHSLASGAESKVPTSWLHWKWL